MISTILLVASGVIAGLIVGLKVIAPLTKNTIDDKVLLYAEDVEKVLEGLGSAPNPGVEVVAHKG